MRKMRLALVGSLLFWAATAPGPALPINCPPEPVTVCNSCLYFGIPSSYRCVTFCVNGVFHRSCNTCGQGCEL